MKQAKSTKDRRASEIAEGRMRDLRKEQEITYKMKRVDSYTDNLKTKKYSELSVQEKDQLIEAIGIHLGFIQEPEELKNGQLLVK